MCVLCMYCTYFLLSFFFFPVWRIEYVVWWYNILFFLYVAYSSFLYLKAHFSSPCRGFCFCSAFLMCAVLLIWNDESTQHGHVFLFKKWQVCERMEQHGLTPWEWEQFQPFFPFILSFSSLFSVQKYMECCGNANDITV